MAFEIKISEDENYFLVTYQNQNTFSEIINSSLKLITLGEKNGIHKVLADLRIANINISDMDRYEFAYNTTDEIGLDRIWKIALLKNIGDTGPDYFETVMTNVGYECKVFIDFEKAANWLISI